MIVPLRIAAALIGGQRYLMGISNRAPCDSNGEAQQLARLDPVPPARLNEAGDRRLRFTPPLACVGTLRQGKCCYSLARLAGMWAAIRGQSAVS